MKKIKYAIAIVLALVITTAGNISAFAKTGYADLSKECSISITLQYNNVPMVNGEFTAYKIADAKSYANNLNFAFTKEMKGFGGNANSLKNEQSKELYNYVTQNGVVGIAKKTDKNGVLKFSSLSAGLYLIAQTGSVDKFTDCSPFIVSLPFFEDGQWKYDIDATPKTDVISYIDISVNVYWDDDDYSKRPKTVTIDLYDGELLIYTVILSGVNDWSYTWTFMPFDGDYRIIERGTPVEYDIDYNSSSGTNFVVINSVPNNPETKPSGTNPDGTKPDGTENGKPDKNKKPSSDNTNDFGESKNPTALIKTGQLNWPIPLMAGTGLFLIAVGWYIYASKKEEIE